MIEHRPKDLNEFLKINSEIRRDSWSPYLAFFRGQSQDWPIVPGVNREMKYLIDEIKNRESALLNEFLQSEHHGYKLQKHFSKDEYEFAQKWLDLFQAQHLGVKTRLTDWTQSYENALSFALQNKQPNDKDAILWIYKCPYTEEYLINFNREEERHYFDLDPFTLPTTVAVKHYGMFDDFMDYQGERRRFRQDGSFLISSSKDLKTPIEDIPEMKQHLEKVFISPELKKQILEEHLNPDLEDYMYDRTDKQKIAEFEALAEKIRQLNLKHFPA